MDEEISKSQKKRDAEALQKLGTSFIALSKEKLDQLPLSSELRRAIDEAKAIKSFGALKRQGLYIGKLMRASDTEAIVEAYNLLKAEEGGQTAHFHILEQWRTRLIHEGKEALTAFVDVYPDVDIQQLRHLVKKAIADETLGKNTGAMKALFRFLRDNV